MSVGVVAVKVQLICMFKGQNGSLEGFTWEDEGGKFYAEDAFFFQAEDGIRDLTVTGVQTCALPIFSAGTARSTMPPIATVSSVTGAARVRPLAVSTVTE